MNKVLDPISSAKVYPSVPTERKPGNEKSTKNLLASDYTASQKHIKGTLKEQRMVFKGANPEKNRHIGHNKAVLCVAALHVEGSDTIVVSGGEGKLCHVWSLRAGSHIAVLDGHSQRISAMATHVSPTEGPMAISASWDESIRLWFLRDCFSQQTVASRAIHSIVAAGAPGERHSNRVLSLAVVTPTGKSAVLVSGAADNTIKIWSLPRGIYQYELKDKDNVTYFLSLGYYNFRCDTFVVSGCRDNTVKVWALQPPLYNEGEKYARSIPVKVIEGHPSRVHSICVVDLSVGKTSDSAEETAATVITSCRDLVIRVFSLANCALLRVMTGAHNTPITALSWCMSPSGDDAFIISTSEGGYICVWSYLSGEKERYFSGHTDSCTCAFTMISPADPTELLIVSGSTDRSVRTWVLAEEVSVVTRKNATRILSMDVYSDGDEKAIIVTGCEKGGLQAENLLRLNGNGSAALNGPYPRGWSVANAHEARVRTVAIYVPFSKLQRPHSVPSGARVDITKPLVISGGRGSGIRLSSIDTGENILGEKQYLLGHTSMVTCAAVFHGRTWLDPHNDTEREILPFIATGSEDNTLKMWRLHSGECFNTLCGHELDVLAVAIYVPPVEKKTRATESGRTTPVDSSASVGGAAAPLTRKTQKMIERELLIKANVPIVISGGMDNFICLWAYEELKGTIKEEEHDHIFEPDGVGIMKQMPQANHLIKRLDDCSTHFNCLATMETNGNYDALYGPVVVAGGGDGGLHIWSMWPPFEKITILNGHLDEVQSICALPTHTDYGAIIASGSFDQTVRLWSLQNMQCIRVVEGHTQEVTEVRLFYPGGGDPALVSVSGDKMIRLINDCLGGIPKIDFVTEQFLLDLNSKLKPLSKLNEIIEWPRISVLVNANGAEAFFSQFYSLFSLAVKNGSADFLIEFLPLATLALLKSNVPYSDKIEVEVDDDEKALEETRLELKEGSLLFHSMWRRDIRAVHVIISRWIAFLNVPPKADTDLLYDDRAQMHKNDLLLLVDRYPKEFERLICSLSMMPWKQLEMPPGNFKYFVEEAAHSLVLKNKNDLQIKGGKNPPLLFMPVKNLCHIDILTAFSTCCTELDSVLIFDSDAGQLALSFCWNNAGLKTHALSMLMYLLKVTMTAFSIYTFDRSMGTDYQWASIAIAVILILFDGYFLFFEFFEFIESPVRYFSVIWNAVIIIVIGSGIVGNIIRIVFLNDTLISRAALSITAIFMWLNVLYYLRAFEATGPLVSMVLRIWKDMQPFLAVLLLVIVGFSQAFWLVSYYQEHNLGDEPPYRSIANSLLFSFSSTLGDFNPGAFGGMPLEDYGILLTCLFTLLSSILLLNLLIALMGDSYAAVKEKGLAQWRLEQADLIIESSSRMTDADKNNDSWIFMVKKTDDIDEDVVLNQFKLPNEIKYLKGQCAELKSEVMQIGQLADLVRALHKKIDRLELTLEEIALVK